jgi:hypothetical protein
MYMRRGGIFLRRSDRWEFMGGREGRGWCYRYEVRGVVHEMGYGLVKGEHVTGLVCEELVVCGDGVLMTDGLMVGIS